MKRVISPLYYQQLIGNGEATFELVSVVCPLLKCSFCNWELEVTPTISEVSVGVIFVPRTVPVIFEETFH